MRSIHLAALLSLTVLACFGASTRADDHPQDKEGVWTLELRYKTLSTITVDVPGKGKKTFHYLRYEIVNNTGEARQAEPAFELVRQDWPGTYKEVLRPDVFKAIVKQEDPDGKLGLKDSATIAKKAIPPSKKDAAPTVVHGVAVWEGVDPTTRRFSVYVAGLSNGMVKVVDDSKDPKGEYTRSKTLQLNFKSDGETIQFVAPPQWLYRVRLREEDPASAALTIVRYEHELEAAKAGLVQVQREREAAKSALARAQMVPAAETSAKEREELVKLITALTARIERLNEGEAEEQKRGEMVKALLEELRKKDSK
jgi:hypothetical protein